MRRVSLLLILIAATPVFAQADDAHARATAAATALVDAGKVDEGIDALKKLAQADGGDTTAAYELGYAYAVKGDHASCRTVLEPLAGKKSAVQLKALGMLGNCLDLLGERANAISTYKRGLDLDPNDSGLLFNLGVTLTQLQRFDEARPYLERDVEHNPSHVSAHLATAQVLEAQNFVVPALLSYLRFLAMEPATSRTAGAAAHMQNLLDRGVEKTAEGANITIDPKPRKEEGDYGSMQTMMAIVSAGRFADEEGKPPGSAFDKARGQVQAFLDIYLEEKSRHTDFTARVQRPFFAAMKKAGVLETFAGIAVSTLKLEGMEAWAQAHDDGISRYFDWLRPQLAAPRVPLPPAQ
jgi:tetratricopeptide (TPR) repeat protein